MRDTIVSGFMLVNLKIILVYMRKILKLSHYLKII